MLGPAIAALPDSVPWPIFLHVFSRETLEKIVYRIDFRGHHERRVKISRGAACTRDTRTKDQRLATWALTVGGGAAAFDIEVLASKPHSEVTEGHKCLRLPNYVFPEK